MHMPCWWLQEAEKAAGAAADPAEAQRPATTCAALFADEADRWPLGVAFLPTAGEARTDAATTALLAAGLGANSVATSTRATPFDTVPLVLDAEEEVVKLGTVNVKVPLAGLQVMPVSLTSQLTVTVAPLWLAILEHSAKLTTASP